MTPNQTELLQGTLDLLILNALTATPLHGLGVARRIEAVTQGTFRVKDLSRDFSRGFTFFGNAFSIKMPQNIGSVFEGFCGKRG